MFENARFPVSAVRLQARRLEGFVDRAPGGAVGQVPVRTRALTHCSGDLGGDSIDLAIAGLFSKGILASGDNTISIGQVPGRADALCASLPEQTFHRGFLA